jgi:hypothetical protein
MTGQIDERIKIRSLAVALRTGDGARVGVGPHVN